MLTYNRKHHMVVLLSNNQLRYRGGERADGERG